MQTATFRKIGGEGAQEKAGRTYNPKLDLTGRSFGRLTVMFRESSRKCNHNVRTVWRCQCACGSETSVLRHNLLSGKTTSCGCWQTEVRQKAPGIAAVHKKFYDYRDWAQKKGRTFGLSEEEFSTLCNNPCFYCGESSTKSHVSGKEFNCNGVDRLDNARGYEQGNVVSCCVSCNFAKRDKSLREFQVWMDSLVRHNSALRG